jgi:hypothetical protein
MGGAGTAWRARGRFSSSAKQERDTAAHSRPSVYAKREKTNSRRFGSSADRSELKRRLELALKLAPSRAP